jgi:hypothetical protein
MFRQNPKKDPWILILVFKIQNDWLYSSPDSIIQSRPFQQISTKRRQKKAYPTLFCVHLLTSIKEFLGSNNISSLEFSNIRCTIFFAIFVVYLALLNRICFHNADPDPSLKDRFFLITGLSCYGVQNESDSYLFMPYFSKNFNFYRVLDFWTFGSASL